MLKKILKKMYKSADNVNTENIKLALEYCGPVETLLDIGCWEGVETLEWGKACKAKKLYGIEVVESAANKAKEKGIKTYACYADKDKWPLKDSSMDCIVTNQVIEHLTDLDHFFSEANRVLKPGGYIVTSTNNLASFHNIFSLFFGWTPFDLANSSKLSLGVGNPLSVSKKMLQERGNSWLHKCIYTVRWLKEWQELYEFKYIKDYGAGLYPFPASLGRVFKLHSAFFTIICKKK